MDHRERISAGQEASAMKAVVEPIIVKRINELLNLMMAEYRSGAPKFDTLLGKTAEISALTGLLDSLENVKRQGEISMEKEHA